MGCLDSKESNPISHLKHQCNLYMYENILALQVIQYLLIDKGNISLAIRVISLKKRTENYYSIITQYRNYWVFTAQKRKPDKEVNKDFDACLAQQGKELEQLAQAKTALTEVIEKLKPGWQGSFACLNDLKEHLEESKSIVMHSSSLYGSYYTEDFKKMKIAALEHSQNIQNFDNETYDKIKSVTVNKYKVLELRVYYTPKILHMKVRDEKKTESKNFDGQDDLINNLKSFEVNHSASGLGVEQPEIVLNDQVSIHSHTDSSFSESDRENVNGR